MNKLLADLTVLYTKVHTYHYNVVGENFKEIHVMLEEEYERMHSWIDTIAENMKIEGEYPVGTLKEMLEITSIKEASSQDYNYKEIFADLITDYKSLMNESQNAKKDATDVRGAILDDFESEIAKAIWFMEATIK